MDFHRRHPMTRVIYITECCQCPFARPSSVRFDVFFCVQPSVSLVECPPTGTPEWCPLEILEPRGSAPDGTQT